MTTRRKKERKISKSSPEKKIEKPKRGRPKRRKKSESTPEPDSGDESKQADPEVIAEGDTVTAIPKESTPEETQAGQDDKQVWQVKTAETSSDTGEIQKLKICLKRPSTTPERIDQSPRSRKKLNRNTSQSDASGTEVDETRRSRHRARKSTRESRDEPPEPVPCEQQQRAASSKLDDTVVEETRKSKDKEDGEHSKTTEQRDVPVVHSNSEDKDDQKQTNEDSVIDKKEKHGTNEHTENESDVIEAETKKDDTPIIETELQCTETTKEIVLQHSESEEKVEICKTPEQKASADSESIESSGSTQTKSNEESNSEKKVVSETDSQKSETKQDSSKENTAKDSLEDECSKASVPVDKENSNNSNEVTSENHVDLKEIVNLNHCEDKNEVNNKENESPTNKAVDEIKERSEDTNHVGESMNAVPARKRRWGKRSSNSKPTLVSISTDSLKDIISDVQPAELDEIMPEKKERRVRDEKKERREEKKERREDKKEREKMDRPLLPTYTIENDVVGFPSKEKLNDTNSSNISAHRKIVLVGDEVSAPPLSPPRHSISSVLHISNLVRPFTLPQLKNLLQRTGKIVDSGFWIDGIKSKCYVQYETEDQAIETRHALHGVTWPMSNPKTLNVDFASEKDLDAARQSEDAAVVSGGPQAGKAPVLDAVKQEYGWDINSKNDRSSENHWERKKIVREWDVGKTEKDKEKLPERRKPHSPQHSPARKFKKTEEEPAPAKMLDDLFKKTKATPYIYWLPLTAETIAVKEEQRRQHMAEHERRLQQLRREPRVRR